MRNIILALIVILLSLGAWAYFYQPLKLSHTEIRASIDIGSGATKLKVAEVDKKINKIVRVIYEQEIAVPYQKSLELSSDHKFSPALMEEGLHSIKVLKQAAMDHQAKKVIGVATAAFRKAENAQAYVNQVQKETGVDIKIIDQNLEGVLAYSAVLAKVDVPMDNLLVWDIGGGSLQLTITHSKQGYFVGKGRTASNPFKRDIIEMIEKQDPATVKSPNPMTAEVMQKAIAHASSIAQNSDAIVREKIKDPKTVIYGVGSLFYIGIREMINGTEVTPENLATAIKQYENKSDSELQKGEHSDVFVSNALLVLGYMKALDIKNVHILNINIADGAMTYPEFWE